MEILSTVVKVFLVVYFFYAVFLAHKIKSRFSELGHDLKANPWLSFMNISFFWSKAKGMAKDVYDDKINKYLSIYKQATIIFYEIIILFVGYVFWVKYF